MYIEQIAIETAFLIILCAFIFGSQLYVAKIVLKNVNDRITKLDGNLAEAIQTVINANIGENMPQINPLVNIFADLLKNSQENNTLRDEKGQFKVIEKKDTSL
jgi:hypothetical protein